MIAPAFAWVATSRMAPSKADMLVAHPAPTPNILVGVLTAMRMMSAREMAWAELQVKNKFWERLDAEEPG